ncbi:MAG: polysaccharide deacetylase family protein [Lachnospiraceae bacterium]|nr:polysaccharide deacetylase family protein [Lachnospiraceae bacterium]
MTGCGNTPPGNSSPLQTIAPVALQPGTSESPSTPTQEGSDSADPNITPEPTLAPTPEPTPEPTQTPDLGPEPTKVFESESWWLSYGEPGAQAQPRGNAKQSDLSWYGSYYLGSPDEKVVYLTFDCGYENGNTELILTALKNHNAKATFFMTGQFLETAPDLVKRILEEGHEAGNHTWNHPDMSAFTDKADFQKELDDVANLYLEITGTEIGPYYRPPEGRCTEENLRWAKDLGYHTIFWALAHVDWYTDNQPDPQESINLLTSRVSPGAVVLLHNTSQTNGAILDDLMTKWEELGYSFRPLSDLTGP